METHLRWPFGAMFMRLALRVSARSRPAPEICPRSFGSGVKRVGGAALPSVSGDARPGASVPDALVSVRARGELGSS